MDMDRMKERKGELEEQRWKTARMERRWRRKERKRN